MHRSSRAPPVPQVEQTGTQSSSSLIDVDSPHISSVPSNYSEQSVKTETQANRLEQEAEARARRESANAAPNQSKGQSASQKGREQAETAADRIRKNSDNPVLIGNAVVLTALAGILGYGGSRWWQQGAKGGASVVAGVVAAVGLFAVGDYYLSRWGLEKYPTRK